MATAEAFPEAREADPSRSDARRPEVDREVDERALRLGALGIAGALAVFLAFRLTAWPPHEDEVLALAVGRQSLDGLLDTVINERGGARPSC